MKIKSLALILASAALLASCGGESSSQPAGASSDPASQDVSIDKPQLDFIEKGQVYFDVHDIDVKFSYGNAALVKGANKLALNDNAYLSVEGTSQQVYNFIIVFESSTGEGHSIGLAIEGDSLADYLSLKQPELVGKERAFVAISMGKPAQWTHGLSEKLDDNLTVWTRSDDSSVA